MEFIKKHREKFKSSGKFLLFSGSVWISYQIYKTHYILSHAVSTNVLELEKKRAEYIYLDPKHKENLQLLLEEASPDKPVLTPLGKWRKWKKTLAWRLVTMAKQDDKQDKLRSIKSLVDLDDLTDSDYWQIAQVCDAHTAVGIARHKGDLRFFLKPSLQQTSNKKELISKIRDFLHLINQKSNHVCLDYFLSKVFPDYHYRQDFDHELSSIDAHKQAVSEEQMIPLCMSALMHHCTLDGTSEDIISHSGLILLMSIYKEFGNDINILMMLAKIISYISLHENSLNHLHVTGWIGVLAKLCRHKDIRVAAPAARALANIDEDDIISCKYPRRIYLLHPIFRKKEKIKTDVVFIHGLLGGVFVTWRQRDNSVIVPYTHESDDKDEDYPRDISDHKTKDYLDDVTELKKEEWDEIGEDFDVVLDDLPEYSENGQGPYSLSGRHHAIRRNAERTNCGTQCWPWDWLAEDCPNLRIIGVNYDTNLSMWAPICPADNLKRNLEERSTELLAKLQRAGLGKRPIIWVAHSMGGLLVKNILVKASESDDEELKKMSTNTKAVVFYSVPHLGSPLAALRQTTSFLLWPSIEVRELRENSPCLLSLHEKFLMLLKKVPIDIVSFAETKPTEVSALKLQYLFVPPNSANPGIGEFFEIPQDHLNICKPASRNSFLYQKLLQICYTYTKNPR